MNIIVNGEKKEFRNKMTIEALLKELDIVQEAVVCELNLEVVSKKNYAENVLKEGDRMEIVKFVGGGNVNSGGVLRRAVYLGVIMIFLSVTSAFAQNWEEVTGMIKDVDLRTIAVSPDNPDVIYVGSSKNLYKSTNSGTEWEQMLSIRGESKAVNFIAVSGSNLNTVYAATRNGLYKTINGGVDWEILPTGIGESQKNITAIAMDLVDSKRLYIGTMSGFMKSEDGGKTWQKGTGELSDIEITFITISPDNPAVIYIAASKGLYKSIDRAESWNRVFVTSQDTDTTSNDETASESREKIKTVTIDKNSPQRLYLATENGAYLSDNAGVSWNRLTEIGLISSNIRHIVYLPEKRILFAATKRGIFAFSEKEERWDEIYSGLREKDCRFLSFDEEKNILWAVTKSGVFKNSVSGQEEKERWMEKEIMNRFSNEPIVRQVQAAAIDYAEVHPDKIRNWRKGAAMRAWLPTFSAGLDSDRNIVSSTGSTATPRIFFEDGPDEIGWDVSLSWDFGDLIWNPSQASSIDTRSKLMVQLRDDILDEVTRLYFARRSLQIELFFKTPEDLRKRIKKELRLQEFTANIDALTGGYLSKNLEGNGQ